MASKVVKTEERKLSIFEKYLTGWVALCIIVGIFIGRAFPYFSIWLDRMSIAHVSIPIAICLFFMMYPIMVKIDFSQVIKTGKTFILDAYVATQAEPILHSECDTSEELIEMVKRATQDKTDYIEIRIIEK